MYAQLGNIIFEGLKGFTSFESRTAANLPRHARIMNKPRLQKIGDELEEISIEITFNAFFCKPQAEIDALRQAQNTGEILPFIKGNGELIGYFAVSENTVTYSETASDGTLLAANVKVALIESAVVDPLTAKETELKQKGFARAINSPAGAGTPVLHVSAAGQTMQAFSEGRAQCEAAATAVAAAKGNPTIEASEVAKAQKALSKARESMEKFQAKLQEIKDDVATAEAIETAANAVISAIESSVEKLGEGDLDGAISATEEMRGAVTKTSGASANIIKLVAIRRK